MAAEAATKEKNLRSREQAVTDSENELRVRGEIVLNHLHYIAHANFYAHTHLLASIHTL